jgi:hypothetical protein
VIHVWKKILNLRDSDQLLARIETPQIAVKISHISRLVYLEEKTLFAEEEKLGKNLVTPSLQKCSKYKAGPCKHKMFLEFEGIFRILNDFYS